MTISTRDPNIPRVVVGDFQRSEIKFGHGLNHLHPPKINMEPPRRRVSKKMFLFKELLFQVPYEFSGFFVVVFVF